MQAPQPEPEAPRPPANQGHRFVNVSAVNIRQQPNTTSNVVGMLSRGARVRITGEQNDWYRVEFQNMQGYILKTLLSEQAPAAPTARGGEEPRQAEVAPMADNEEIPVAVAANSNAGGNIVEIARRYLGHRYVLRRDYSCRI